MWDLIIHSFLLSLVLKISRHSKERLFIVSFWIWSVLIIFQMCFHFYFLLYTVSEESIGIVEIFDIRFLSYSRFGMFWTRFHYLQIVRLWHKFCDRTSLKTDTEFHKILHWISSQHVLLAIDFRAYRSRSTAAIRNFRFL